MNQNSIIAKQGYPFIVPLAIMALFFVFLKYYTLSILFFTAALFVIWFFRNPERITPEDERMIISPADGKVIKIENVEKVNYLNGQSKKISIFMNVFNVHVNRAPCSGKIEAVFYRAGRFFSADLDKASSLNEKNSLLIKTDDGKIILTEQIAGLIARRIECWVGAGTYIKKGERFGLIRFGSRLDVYVPVDTLITVNIGDKVRAGETQIGWLQ